jgi:hypothetical protein
MNLSPLEKQRRADETEGLLNELRIQGKRSYWDRRYDELGGRMPAEALADGDEDAVRELIAAQYRRSEQAVDRLRQDPEFVAWLEERRSEVALRHPA